MAKDDKNLNENDDELDVKAGDDKAKKLEGEKEAGEAVVIEEAGEDKRLGADEQAETPEQRAERRRGEKKERRERQRQARAKKDFELEELRSQNLELRQQVQGVVQHITRQGASNLEERLAAAHARAKEATEILGKAIKAGDEEAMTQALEIRDNARDEARALEAYKHQAAAAAQTRAQPKEAPPPDREVVRRAKEFKDAHPWYDDRLSDQDSKILRAIDIQVEADGFDPRTDDYWDEIEERAEKLLPHRFAGDKRPPPGNRGPQLGSGRSEGQGGKRTVFVSQARKEAMVEAGIWDDPKRRAAMLKRYEEQDKQRAMQ